MPSPPFIRYSVSGDVARFLRLLQLEDWATTEELTTATASRLPKLLGGRALSADGSVQASDFGTVIQLNTFKLTAGATEDGNILGVAGPGQVETSNQGTVRLLTSEAALLICREASGLLLMSAGRLRQCIHTAGLTAHLYPVEGDTWFDPAAKRRYVYTDSTWVEDLAAVAFTGYLHSDGTSVDGATAATYLDTADTLSLRGNEGQIKFAGSTVSAVTGTFTSSSSSPDMAGVLGLTSALGASGVRGTHSGTSGFGVLGTTLDGTAGVKGTATIYLGVLGSSTNGTGGQFFSTAGTYHALFGEDTGNNRAAIERVRGWLTWFYTYAAVERVGRLKTANITADREWTLPDESGTLTLTSHTHPAATRTAEQGAPADSDPVPAYLGQLCRVGPYDDPDVPYLWFVASTDIGWMPLGGGSSLPVLQMTSPPISEPGELSSFDFDVAAYPEVSGSYSCVGSLYNGTGAAWSRVYMLAGGTVAVREGGLSLTGAGTVFIDIPTSPTEWAWELQTGDWDDAGPTTILQDLDGGLQADKPSPLEVADWYDPAEDTNVPTSYSNQENTFTVGALGQLAAVNGTLAYQCTDISPMTWTPTGTSLSSYVSQVATLSDYPTTFPPTIGSTGSTAVAGNDSRLTNARTPTAHTHPGYQLSDSATSADYGKVMRVSAFPAVVSGEPADLIYPWAPPPPLDFTGFTASTNLPLWSVTSSGDTWTLVGSGSQWALQAVGPDPGEIGINRTSLWYCYSSNPVGTYEPYSNAAGTLTVATEPLLNIARLYTAVVDELTAQTNLAINAPVITMSAEAVASMFAALGAQQAGISILGQSTPAGVLTYLGSTAISRSDDLSRNNADVGSSPTTDPEFVFSLEADAVYRVEWNLMFNFTTNCGCKLQFATPTLASAVNQQYYGGTQRTDTESAISITGSTIALAGYAAGTSGPRANFGHLYLYVGGSPGTLELQWSQSTAHADLTTLLKNSFIEVKKIN